MVVWFRRARRRRKERQRRWKERQRRRKDWASVYGRDLVDSDLICSGSDRMV
ncbi:hypothetical protein Hanom_Chr06g00563571 [Helianthus anomalus]